MPGQLSILTEQSAEKDTSQGVLPVANFLTNLLEANGKVQIDRFQHLRAV